MERIDRVKGTNDFLPPEWASVRGVSRDLESVFESFGYAAVDVPIVETTDLYLKKAGGDQLTKMYSFVDQGGRKISLRPEITASIIRLFVESGEALPLPVRWQYSGPVFRYERPQRGRYRQFIQQGVALIGARGPEADAEVIGLACQGLDRIGVRDYRVVIGHVGLALQLLDGLGLSERLKTVLLGSLEGIGKRNQGPAYVRRRLSDLFEHASPSLDGEPNEGRDDQIPVQTDLTAMLNSLPPDQARQLVNSLLRGMNLEFTGSRTPNEIADRFMRRLRQPDEARLIDRAFDFMTRLAEIVGSPPTVFEQARALLESEGLSAAPLDELVATIDLLRLYNVSADRLTIDFGLARGLAYYTGMVFEIYGSGPSDAAQLGGGGRYDGLVRALGGRRDLPAIGFAYGIERLVESLPATATVSPVDVLVAPSSPDAFRFALQIASSLRRSGRKVELDLRGRSRRANLEYANRRGIPEVVIVDRDDMSSGTYTIREMATGQERQLAAT